MLDSSPVALPPIPRPLKRSASTASLPTPPRTHRKRRNGGSRASSDSDTDLGSSASDSDAGDSAVNAHKKRRMSEVNEAEEEAFWMNASSSMPKSSTAKAGSTGSDTRSKGKAKASTEAPPPVLYRRLNSRNTTAVAPVSPPPSHRKPTAKTTPAISSVPNSPPITPDSKFPMRDSPNNPFLDSSPCADSDSASGTTSSEPRTPQQERSTVTYVFRGVRGTFPNPMYDHANKRPLSPSANSRLPIDHPDFSPAPHCPPKLLFPRARRSKKTASVRQMGEKRSNNSKKRALSITGSDSEGGDGAEDDSPVSPIKLDFGGSPRSRRGAGLADSSRA